MPLDPDLNEFTTSSQVIASYNAIELLSGVGYATMYAGGTIDKKVLSNITFYANPMGSDGLLSGTNLDVDFDVTIQTPVTFKGTAILNIPERIRLGSDAGSCSFVAKIYKVVDGTETELATNTGSTFTGTTSTTKYRMECFDLTLAETTFNYGDILRLNITGSGSTGGTPGPDRNFGVGHDPKNRSVGWDTTGAVPSQMAIQLPVKIDL